MWSLTVTTSTSISHWLGAPPGQPAKLHISNTHRCGVINRRIMLNAKMLPVDFYEFATSLIIVCLEWGSVKAVTAAPLSVHQAWKLWWAQCDREAKWTVHRSIEPRTDWKRTRDTGLQSDRWVHPLSASAVQTNEVYCRFGRRGLAA